MLQIPNKKKWIQVNGTEVLGNIWASFNVDLSDNLGRLRVGRRTIVSTNATDDADLGLPVAFRSLYTAGNEVYAVCGTRVFKNSGVPNGNFTEVASSPTDCHMNYSDMEVFNSQIYVSRNSTSVSKYDGTTWTSVSSVGTSTGVIKLMTTFADRLYVTDGSSKIVSLNSSDTVATIGNAYTLDFSANSATRIITFIRASASRIWIGTTNRLGGIGYIHEWDGISTQVTKSYRLEASGAMACVIKDDIPYVMDSNGNLIAWNGGSFQVLTGFNRENHKLLTGILNTVTQRFIHPNGMSIVEGKINMLINGVNNDNTGTIEDTIPSGVYEYDKEFGLVHKHSIGLTKLDDTISDFGQIKVARVGALQELNIPSDSANRNGCFYAGVQVYTDASSTRYQINYDDLIESLQKAGHLITTKIDSPNVDEVWQKVYLKVARFLTANDKMVVKYRTDDISNTEFTGTWTSTTTFTTTTNLSAYGVGAEVQVTQGIGSGKPSHITSITGSGTFTVTVDETYTGATGTFKATVDSWLKLGSLSNQVSRYLECPIGKTSNWIQFKIWFTFTGRKNELEEILLVNTPNQQPK